ncbi:MAG: hypothetical protein H0W88_00040 [Parachlamydiaceae bacterium]|nr:hypothetical protein [Parachlamydiaceae bacterium]
MTPNKISNDSIQLSAGPMSNSAGVYRVVMDSDVLANCIYERCIKRSQLVDLASCGRPSLKGISMVFSAAAKIPTIPIAMKLPIGEVFAGGSVLAFFGFEYWAISAAIDDVLGKKSQPEYVLMKNAGKGKSYQTKVLISSVVLSLLSQISSSLPCLDYCPDGLKVPGFVVMFVSGSLLPTRSIQLTIDKIIQAIRQKKLEETGKKLEGVRTKMVGLITSNKDIFIQLNLEDKMDYILRLNQSKGDPTSRESIPSNYWDVLLQDDQIEKPKESCGKRICKNTGYIFGPILNTVFQYCLSDYTFSKTKEHITSNPIAAGILTTGVIGSGIYLSTLAVTIFSQRAWKGLWNKCHGIKEETVASQLRPKISLALKFLGVLVDVAAMGPSWVVWGDFYKDETVLKQLFFRSSCCGATLLFVMIATFDLIDNIILAHITSKGDPNDKQILELYNELSLVSNLLSESSHFDFVFMVSGLSPNMKQVLLTQVELEIQHLDDYRGRLLLPPEE